MSIENSTVKDRIAALKEAKAKPNPTTEDLAEREQLIVLASRIEAEAVALHEERKRGHAATREQAESLEHALKSQGLRLTQSIKQDLTKIQTEHQKAFEYWSEHLARTAPFCPEIYNDRNSMAALQDVPVEILNLICCCYLVHMPVRLLNGS